MLSEAKRDRILQAQTSTARKVYDAIPISEPWNLPKIVGELERRGVVMDYAILVGCINTLIRNGLASEPERKTYIRTPVRAKAVQAIVSSVMGADEDDTDDTDDTIQHEEITHMASPTTAQQGRQQHGRAQSPQATAIDRLGALAAKATAMSMELKRLSSEIETVALEIAEQIADVEAKAEKLRQFQTLLAEINK